MSCQHSTQKQLVLKHMRQMGLITTLIAFKRYSICRLSERIRELEHDGHPIHRVPIERNGKRYVGYFLSEGRKRAA
jgi:hypothetical protein